MLEIYKIVTFCGIFEVGQQGVRKIKKNEESKGDFIVFYDKSSQTVEVDVRSRDILVYWR